MIDDENRLSGALHKCFYVYYLLDAVTGELLYIGRSHAPKDRLIKFRHKSGREVVFGMHQRHSTFEAAQLAERTAIAKHRPPYNAKVMSASGMQGKTQSPETRGKIRLANLGQKRSAETRARISAHRKGKPTNLGRRWSAEARANMSAAAKRREEIKRGA